MADALDDTSSNGSVSATATTSNDADEHGIVAVGAVAHVIRRAFHQFYSDAAATVAESGDASRNSEQSAPAEADTAVATMSASSTPRTDSVSSRPAVSAPTDSSDGSEHDARALPAPPSNPLVLAGAVRCAEIERERERQHDAASALLAFLDGRHRTALAADDAAAKTLSDRGLVVKAQTPIGPSTLQLDASDVAHFGAIADDVVHAAQLVREYNAARLQHSGNGPERHNAAVAPGMTREPRGYLDATDASTIRTVATLAHHEHRIEHVKSLHSGPSNSRKSVDTLSSASSSHDTDGALTDATTTLLPLSPSAATRTNDTPAPAAATMSAGETRANLAILQRMHTKLDYLRNPRFATATDSDSAVGSTANANSAGSATSCFVVVPSPVAFTDYDAGGVYEQLVYVRNTSGLSRRVRVLPPATLAFSIAEIVFPDASGLVAPGMHVQLRLRFAPDSRADYKDALRIAHESSNSSGSSTTEFTVVVTARRTPPELSIPLVLRAQDTLVGDCSVTTLPCRNTGGRARFWLMTERDWARHEASATRFLEAAVCDPATSSSSDSVELGAFTLSPRDVELGTNESVALTLTYAPSRVGEQRQQFVMVCDNCLVRVFQIVGRGCQVELRVSSVDDKTVDARIAHMGVVDHVGFDPSVAVHARATQHIVVANDTPIALRYTWRLTPTKASTLSVATTDSNHPPPFEISPSAGTLARSATTAFAVAFAPLQARVHAWTAALVVHDIPACSVPGPAQRAQLLHAFERLQASVQNVVLAADVPCLRVQLTGTAVLGRFSVAPPYWHFSSRDGTETGTDTADSRTNDQPWLLLQHVTYTAHVELCNDTTAPVAFAIDTTRVQQRSIRSAAQSQSNTTTAATISSSSNSAFDLVVSPATGELAPHTRATIAVVFTPHCVGAFSLALPCCIPTASSSIDSDSDDARFVRSLLLEGCVARGAVAIVSPEVDFGLVLVGASAEASLTLCNTASVAADWRLVHVEAAAAASDAPRVTSVVHHRASDAGGLTLTPSSVLLQSTNQHEARRGSLQRSNSARSIASRRRSTSSNASVSSSGNGNDTSRSGSSLLFTARDVLPRATVTFVPESGTLAPGETRTVKVLCLAGSLPERLRATFRCELRPERTFDNVVASTSAACVSARAEIQAPNVFLSPSRLTLGTTYLGVAVHRTVELVNVSNLEAAFKFVEPPLATAGSSRTYVVEFTPRTGTIRSKETLAVTITYTPKQAGRTVALLACVVRGLAAPLGFEIATTHKGLVLSYEMLPPGADDHRTNDALSLMLPPSPKAIALARGMALADCDLEPESTVIPKLLFGGAIALGVRRTLHVLIRNFSGIEAVVDLEAKRFPAQRALGVTSVSSSSSDGGSDARSTAAASLHQQHSGQPATTRSPTVLTSPIASKTRAKRVTGSNAMTSTTSSSSPTATTTTTTTSSRKKLLLADAHEQSQRFQSQRGREYVQQRAEDIEARDVLSSGRGVAFELRPNRMHIPPWEQRVASIVCYNNMPGSYADDIVSRAVGAPPVFLHAQATVVGSPLTLDRNCVGLSYSKRQRPARADGAAIDPSQQSQRAGATAADSVEQPTLHFGQLCTRAAPVTRTLRVVNRGPKHARVKWKLVERGREHELVALSLRLDFSGRVQLRLAVCDDAAGAAAFPFTVEPTHAVVAPFATVAFDVTYTASATDFGAARALLLADAHWYDATESVASQSLGTLERADSLDDQYPSAAGQSHSSSHKDEQHVNSVVDSRCESPTSKRTAAAKVAPPHTAAAAAAAGKAFVAVRAANSLARRALPGSDRSNSAVLMSATPSHVSAKCLRVLLSADVVEPELSLDRSPSLLSAKQPGISTTSLRSHALLSASQYHIKFTTWSTVVATAHDASHAFHRQELWLANRQSARLTFRLESIGPFAVVRADSLAPKHPLSSAELPPAHRRAHGESFLFTLPPQMSVRIDLRFDPTRLETGVPSGLPVPSVSSVPALTPLPTAAASSNPSGLQSTTAAAHPLRRRVSAAVPPQRSSPTPTLSTAPSPTPESQRLTTVVEGQLLVRFANRSIQTLTLAADVLRPRVVVSPSVHFFGHVHITQFRSVVLRLANPTAVPAAFTIASVPAPAPLTRAQRLEVAAHDAQCVDDPNVFTFSTRDGVVAGPTTTLRSTGGALPTTDTVRDVQSHPLVHEPVAVRVVFQPQTIGRRYRSRFRFVVAHGVDFDVVLEGEGHRHEMESRDQSRALVQTRMLEHSDRIFSRIVQ